MKSTTLGPPTETCRILRWGPRVKKVSMIKEVRKTTGRQRGQGTRQRTLKEEAT